MFGAKVLDITKDVLAAKFANALAKVASLSLALGYPIQASIPHSIANTFKILLTFTIQCNNFTFYKAAPYKQLLGCGKKGEEATAPAEEAASTPVPTAAANY